MPRLRVAGLVVLFAVGTALAQPPAGEGGGGAGRERVRQPGGGGGGGFGGGGFGGMMGGGMGGMGGMGQRLMEAPLTTEDLGKMGELLALTPDQRDAAAALLEGHMASFAEKAAEARDAMEKAREAFRETRDREVWQGVGERMQALRESRTKAEADFMADVRALLTPEQEAKWPVLERTRRRETTVQRGLMSGERIDLTRLVAQAEPTPEQAQALKPILESYELELDAALIRRNETQEKAMGQMRDFGAMMESGDFSQMQKMMDENREASMRVRDVNRRYAQQVAGVLGEEKGAAFSDRFRRDSFPMVYRPRPTEGQLKAAESLPDLDEAQKTSLKAIREAYERDSAALNERAEKAMEQFETTATVEGMMRGGPMNDPTLREARTARNQLEDKTIESIRALLTEAQRAALPERRAEGAGGNNPDRPERRPGMRGGRGQGNQGGGTN